MDIGNAGGSINPTNGGVTRTWWWWHQFPGGPHKTMVVGKHSSIADYNFSYFTAEAWLYYQVKIQASAEISTTFVDAWWIEVIQQVIRCQDSAMMVQQILAVAVVVIKVNSGGTTQGGSGIV